MNIELAIKEVTDALVKSQDELKELKQAVRSLADKVHRFSNLSIDLYHFVIHAGEPCTAHWDETDKKYISMVLEATDVKNDESIQRVIKESND